jgi:hypothetical protein
MNADRSIGLTHAAVRLAGHSKIFLAEFVFFNLLNNEPVVPTDAPDFAYDLVKRFVGRKGFA